MELIDKDAVVAEIEKRLDELLDLLPNASEVVKDNYTKDEANITGKYTALESFSKFLDTLEVKEVDENLPNNWLHCKPTQEQLTDLYHAATMLSVSCPTLKSLYHDLK